MATRREAGDESEADIEEKELVRFSQAEEFLALLLGDDFYPGGIRSRPLFLASSSQAESSQDAARREKTLRKLASILDEYQELSHLLDSHLEDIVVPVVEGLQQLTRVDFHLRASTMYSTEAQRLAHLLYYFTKVRGYKTVVHFFPHTVEDLLPTLKLLERYQHESERSTWEMRYILLLWLSLVCMIPFDLSKFDEESDGNSRQTASRIQHLGRHFLASPGKERDAASITLAKLFQRKDASNEDFHSFLNWARSVLLSSPEPSIFIATGILQTLCSVVKVASPGFLAQFSQEIQSIVSLYSSDVDDVRTAAGRADIQEAFRFSNNSLVNRFKAKMSCRLGMKMLRPKIRRTARVTLGASGTDAKSAEVDGNELSEVEEEEIPEEIDGYIADLLGALQDKDTVVRYSAAKGISRLCSRLPDSFVEQVSDTVTEMFSVNVADLLGKREDLSNVSEYTWQGCCLALAELARRGLLSGDNLIEKLEWVKRALVFDVRRGAHSVGTGVRDAACYVLWAIARAHEPEAIRPMASALSHRLVCVALLDRDVSIRRAASAAFQECVGRLNLFEHGIDIIRKTDFYAVGVRRNAFLECTPQVAIHRGYREAILEHLLDVSIVHWDSSMRHLGAAAVAKIAESMLQDLAPTIITRMQQRCKSGDSAVLHGALCTLAELADVCHSSADPAVQSLRTTICLSLNLLPRYAIRPLAASMIVVSACRLLAMSVTLDALQNNHDTVAWQGIVDAALKRQEEDVQIAAADAVAAISLQQDCSTRVEGVMGEWKSLSTSQQQSNARLLGRICFRQHSAKLPGTLLFLASLVQQQSPMYSTNIETRRNALESMTSAMASLGAELDSLLDPQSVRAVLTAMLVGLEDYTSDARGDVGSWVRLACLSGIRQTIELLAGSSKQALGHWVDQELFDSLCAGFFKQMVERIDAVRAHAAQECFAMASFFATGQTSTVIFMALERVQRVFTRTDDYVLKDPAWLLPRVIQLLPIPEYRGSILKGMVLCIGGQKDLANRILATSLGNYLLDDVDEIYSPAAFVSDVVDLAKVNIRNNRYFTPCLQTLSVLFEEGAVEVALKSSNAAQQSFRQALSHACKNLKNIKSVARVAASSQLVINLLSIPELRQDALTQVPGFLLHPFPTVRSSAAELLYSAVQDYLDAVSDEAEDLLLSTSWSQKSTPELAPIVDSLMVSLTTP